MRPSPVPRRLPRGLGTRALPAALLLALLAGIWVPPAAAEIVEIEAALSRGIDSNPMELSADPETGAFTEARLDATVRPEARRRFGFIADLAGVQRRHESRLDGADRGWADLRAGISLVLHRRGVRRLALAAGGTLGAYRTTLIDPDTGRVYEQASPTGATVRIPDRLDFDSSGAFLQLRWQLQRDLLLYLEAETRRRDYVDDYDGAAGLEPLDDRSRSLEPGARIRLLPGMILDLSYRWSRRDYDDLSALDRSAFEVPGTDRQYTYGRYRVALSARPGEKWDLFAGFRATSREDRYAGYYDCEGRSSVLSVGFAPRERTRLRATASWRVLDYRNASVDNDPSGQTRESGIRRLLGVAEQDLGERLSLFLEAGTESSDNRDQVYVYDRTWAQGGVKVRL